MWKIVKIIGGTCSLAWGAFSVLLRVLGDVDFIVERIQNPGWVGKMLNWLNSLPPIVNLFIILVGLMLIYWSSQKSYPPQTLLRKKEKPEAQVSTKEGLKVQAPEYVVAEGKSITSIKGLLGAGESVLPEYLGPGGVKTFGEFIEKGLIVVKQENEKESKNKLEILFEQNKEPFLEIISQKTTAEAIYEVKDYSKKYIGRFIIKNLSKTEAIRRIRVDLLEITPSQGWVTGLPLPLRFQHDNQARHEIDLNTDSEVVVEVFDYFYMANDAISTRLVLLHPLNNRLIEVYGNIMPMQFTVRISSENGGEGIVKYFKFNNTKNDKDMWRMLND